MAMAGSWLCPYSFNGHCRLMINLVAKEVGNKQLKAIGAIRVLAFDYEAHSYQVLGSRDRDEHEGGTAKLDCCKQSLR